MALGTNLKAFVETELTPLLAPRTLIASGPDAVLDARACNVLGPVLRELFGKLSLTSAEANARPTITWLADELQRCVIVLTAPHQNTADQSNPSPSPGAAHPAFDQQGRGEGMIHFEVSDCTGRIIVPAQYVAFENALPAPASVDPFRDRTLLVVEDQLIIALDLEMVLRDHGAANVHVVGTVSEALRIIASTKLDAAVLDINLGSSTSFPVARELLWLGIPFIFATGYGNEIEFPADLRSAPLVSKPYCEKSIRESLTAACLAVV